MDLMTKQRIIAKMKYIFWLFKEETISLISKSWYQIRLLLAAALEGLSNILRIFTLIGIIFFIKISIQVLMGKYVGNAFLSFEFIFFVVSFIVPIILSVLADLIEPIKFYK